MQHQVLTRFLGHTGIWKERKSVKGSSALVGAWTLHLLCKLEACRLEMTHVFFTVVILATESDSTWM